MKTERDSIAKFYFKYFKKVSYITNNFNFIRHSTGPALAASC